MATAESLNYAVVGVEEVLVTGATKGDIIFSLFFLQEEKIKIIDIIQNGILMCMIFQLH